jgi:hypothetical protein
MADCEPQSISDVRVRGNRGQQTGGAVAPLGRPWHHAVRLREGPRRADRRELAAAGGRRLEVPEAMLAYHAGAGLVALTLIMLGLGIVLWIYSMVRLWRMGR